MSERIKNTTCFIRSRLNIAPKRYFTDLSAGVEAGGLPAPEVGIILGSGLGDLVREIEMIASLDYAEIPDFPRSTVEGHRGRFIYGRLGGKYVIAMEGRVHYYEGYPVQEVVLPVRAMCCLGIDTLVVSNAAGGLSPLFGVGDIMVIEDHINLIPNPLVGPNDKELGVRFPDMGEPYDRALIERAHGVARGLGFSLRQGCYVGLTGPSFETRAEVRYFGLVGGHAVGMSTTPEVIVARHQKVRVLGLSLITNALAVTADAPALTHEEVIEAAGTATPRMCALVRGVVADL